MTKELQWQQAFVKRITQASPLQTTGETLYQDLLYYRFEEVFENAFPRFKSIIGDTMFSQLIRDFIKEGCDEPILWRCSGKFMPFVSQSDVALPPFSTDLMRFEFTHIEMMMHHYKRYELKAFSLKKLYHLNCDVTILNVTHPVHHPDFDENYNKNKDYDDHENFEAGSYHLLCYADHTQLEIMVEEISPFLLALLTTLNQPLQQKLQEMAFEYEISLDELVDAIEPTLIRLHQLEILIEP